MQQKHRSGFPTVVIKKTISILVTKIVMRSLTRSLCLPLCVFLVKKVI